jgi:hypothetical protein
VKTVDDKELKSEDLVGKVVLTCALPKTHDALQGLARLQRAHATDLVVVAFIRGTVTPAEIAKARELVKREDLPFPVALVDAKAQDTQLLGTQTFLVDKDGQVRGGDVGYFGGTTPERLEVYVKILLDAK